MTLAEERLPRVELEILRGRAKNKIRRIDVPVFLIGSAPDCDLVLADPAFPAVHTYVYVNPSGVSVRRLGEGPQLAVDGREVQSAVISDGQTLFLGRYEFNVRISWGGHDKPALDEDTPSLAATHLRQWQSVESPAVALVRSLLEDIRSSLKVESNLQLYSEHSPWQAITAGTTLLVRKASA